MKKSQLNIRIHPKLLTWLRYMQRVKGACITTIVERALMACRKKEERLNYYIGLIPKNDWFGSLAMQEDGWGYHQDFARTENLVLRKFSPVDEKGKSGVGLFKWNPNKEVMELVDEAKHPDALKNAWNKLVREELRARK